MSVSSSENQQIHPAAICKLLLNVQNRIEFSTSDNAYNEFTSGISIKKYLLSQQSSRPTEQRKRCNQDINPVISAQPEKKSVNEALLSIEIYKSQ